MTKLQREKMLNLLSNCCEFGEGWIKAIEIDRYGLARSLKLGTSRALRNLMAQIFEEIIMDGKVNYIPKKFKKASCMVDGDNLLPIISAASVYAKVSRDNFMIGLAKKYPAYKFENHVGYGTPEHLKAINSYGPLKFIHRLTYAPIFRLANQSG